MRAASRHLHAQLFLNSREHAHFLDLNGIEIPEATDELYDAMIGIAERRLGNENVAAVLRRVGASR